MSRSTDQLPVTPRPRALVTGGALRLGRAMVLDLAAGGWDVAVHFNRSADAADDTVSEARARGSNAVTIGADLIIEDEVAGLVPRAAEAIGGPLSLLINNASIFEDDRVGTITRESWDKAFESNLRAPVHLTQAFAAQAPQARPDRNGEPVARSVVINMLDQRVLKPTPRFQSYYLAKSALFDFTRTAAMELAPHIRVAAIGPGPTLPASGQSDDHFRSQRRSCILKRGADPEDIVQAMRFIIANKAFTGQMLAIDGGQHLAWQTRDVLGDA